MNVLKKIALVFVGAASMAVTSCKNSVDRFNDFKEDHPKATRADFIKHGISNITLRKKPYDVGQRYQQREESVYGYHYGYDVWKGSFRWHWGFYDKDRNNTPEENRQDSLAYEKRVMIKDSIDKDYARYKDALPAARLAVTLLATTKNFNDAAKDKKNPDSLNISMFAQDANALARACALNNDKIVIARTTDLQSEKTSYKAAYRNVMSLVQKTHNQTVYVQRHNR